MSERVTRRRFVTGTLATGAASPSAAAGGERATPPRHRSAAARTRTWRSSAPGFAGLTAARTSLKAGHSVIVLEARNRVGGRVWNHDLGGGHVSERGGTFVGPTQDHVLALAD